jgi:hypothetical protein
MRDCLITAVGQERLEIRAIMIVFTSLRDVDSVETDVTLTEQRVKKIVGHDRVVRIVHVLPRALDQFTPDV